MTNVPDKTNAQALAARLRRIADKPAIATSAYHGRSASRDRAPRQATFKPAAITLDGGGRMDVIVKNISETGVRIEFVPQITLPRQVLMAEPTLPIHAWALVVWQGDGAAGLQFLAG